MRNRYAEAVEWVDQALSLPRADAHPALRVRALDTKARCLYQMGSAPSNRGSWPRWKGAPVGLAIPRSSPGRSDCASNTRWVEDRLDLADALADEALHWARTAGDEWEIAEASRAKAIAASGIAELRERVDRAAALLTDVGSVHQLANLPQLCRLRRALPGERARRDRLCCTCCSDRSSARQPVRRNDQHRQRGPGRPVDRQDRRRLARVPRGTRALPRDGRRPVAFEGLRGLAAVAVVERRRRARRTLVGAADAHR